MIKISCKKDIIEEILKADTLLNSYLIFEKNIELLKDCKFMFAEKGISNIPEYSRKRYFSHGSAIFNIFSSEKIVFLDEKIVRDMKKGNAQINLDYSVSIDTQGISCLEPYFRDKKSNRLPRDFEEIFNYLVLNNVNIDPMPYIIENVQNIKEKKNEERIKSKLSAYEILKNIDVEEYKNSNKIISKKTQKEMEDEISYDIDFMITMANSGRLGVEEHYRLRYCLLLKMILINIRSKRKPYEKLIEFIEFCHSELCVLSLREIIIANRYYKDGQSLSFFGKIQRDRGNLIKEIKNMTWDLYHVSEMERNFWMFSKNEDYYHIPAFLTFDKRLIEIIELYSLKAICISGNNDIYPLHDMSDFIKIMNGNIDIEKYMTDEAEEQRESKRESVNIINIIDNLEKEFLLI